MAPNAIGVLRRLGLGPGLDRVGVCPLTTHQRRWQDGRTLQYAPLNPRCEELYGAPHMTLHRADLLAVIASVRQQSSSPFEVIVVVDHNDDLLERLRAHVSDINVVASMRSREIAFSGTPPRRCISKAGQINHTFSGTTNSPSAGMWGIAATA